MNLKDIIANLTPHDIEGETFLKQKDVLKAVEYIEQNQVNTSKTKEEFIIRATEIIVKIVDEVAKHGNYSPAECTNLLSELYDKLLPDTISKNDAEAELPDILRSYWAMMMNGYLRQNVKLGIREFRIAMQDDNRFIIHPLNVDGETFDFAIDI